jgi:hypothetical protein
VIEYARLVGDKGPGPLVRRGLDPRLCRFYYALAHGLGQTRSTWPVRLFMPEDRCPTDRETLGLGSRECRAMGMAW